MATCNGDSGKGSAPFLSMFTEDGNLGDGEFEDALLYWASEGGPDSSPTNTTTPVGGATSTRPDLSCLDVAGHDQYPLKDISSLFESGMMRGVHMEVQENAKVPVLYTDQVDRSDSSHVLRVPSDIQSPTSSTAAKQQKVEDAGTGRKIDTTNLAEKFLRSSNRASAALNYSTAGELSRQTSLSRNGPLAFVKPGSQHTSDGDTVGTGTELGTHFSYRTGANDCRIKSVRTSRVTKSGLTTKTSGAGNIQGAASSSTSDVDPTQMTVQAVSAQSILETASALAATASLTAGIGKRTLTDQPRPQQQPQPQPQTGNHKKLQAVKAVSNSTKAQVEMQAPWKVKTNVLSRNGNQMDSTTKTQVLPMSQEQHQQQQLYGQQPAQQHSVSLLPQEEQTPIQAELTPTQLELAQPAQLQPLPETELTKQNQRPKKQPPMSTDAANATHLYTDQPQPQQQLQSQQTQSPGPQSKVQPNWHQHAGKHSLAQEHQFHRQQGSDQPRHYYYYPYVRTVPLPIPSPPSPPVPGPDTHTSSSTSDSTISGNGPEVVRTLKVVVDPRSGSTSSTHGREEVTEQATIAECEHVPAVSAHTESKSKVTNSTAKVITKEGSNVAAAEPIIPSSLSKSAGSTSPAPQHHHHHHHHIHPYPPLAAAHHPGHPPFLHHAPSIHSRAWVSSSPQHHRQGTMTTSIQDAATKHNQFGFGGNHVVPSIPVTPMQLMQQKRRPPVQRKAKHPPEVGVAAPPSPPGLLQQATKRPLPPSVSSIPASVSNRDTYERKKQKAKDSRVKLNESIGRLSVAMGIAGSQSLRRAQILKGTAGASTVQAMEECSKAASAAKKYDRPAFVGYAATLVQALNDQCEALVREVRVLQNSSPVVGTATAKVQGKQAGLADIPGSAGVGGCETNANDDVTRSYVLSTNGQKRSKIDTFNSSLKQGHVPSPRRPCERSWMKCAYDSFTTLVAHGPVLKSIASYLDPITLLRCQVVSKYWKSIDEFQSDETWAELCFTRFGRVKVDEWERKCVSPSASGESVVQQESRYIQLYKAMNEANVGPYTSFEGNLQLGEAKADGVSAWASMMARSNGETLRSVKRDPKPSRNCAVMLSKEYTSLPVVELRILVQNTGVQNGIVLPEQALSVDASTRRRGEELAEITSDERLAKRCMNMDGSSVLCSFSPKTDAEGEMIRLRLFDSVMLQVHIHARGCPTTSKFNKKANFTKLLVSANGTTFPIIIPFDKGNDASLGIAKVQFS